MVPFVLNLAPDADALAKRESIDVDLSSIAVGRAVRVAWRGSPVLVKHRTEGEIAEARAGDPSTSPGPRVDQDGAESNHPRWLVVIAVCTYERCVVEAGFGPGVALICPCCASAYDGAGRVTRGPAPKRLEVPPHAFPSERRLRIG